MATLEYVTCGGDGKCLGVPDPKVKKGGKDTNPEDLEYHPDTSKCGKDPEKGKNRDCMCLMVAMPPTPPKGELQKEESWLGLGQTAGDTMNQKIFKEKKDKGYTITVKCLKLDKDGRPFYPGPKK